MAWLDREPTTDFWKRETLLQQFKNVRNCTYRVLNKSPTETSGIDKTMLLKTAEEYKTEYDSYLKYIGERI